MAIQAHLRTSVRALLMMLVIILGLVAALAAANTWGNNGSHKAQWTPKLGLDLEGGTQVVLQPNTPDGQPIADDQLKRAQDIIRNRVDAQGVAESEVSMLGDNLVVSIPGTLSEAQRRALQSSSQMRFRPVLSGEQIAPPTPVPTPSVSGKTGAPQPSPAKPTTKAAAKPGATPTPAAPTTQRAVVAEALRRHPAQTPAPTPGNPFTTPAEPPPPVPTPTSAPTGPPKRLSAEEAKDPAKLIPYAMNQGWAMAPEWKAKLAAYKCSDADKPVQEDLMAPVIACDEEGTYKYLLGPAVMTGEGIASASGGAAVNNQGQPIPGQYVVNLRLKDQFHKLYHEVSKAMLPMGEQGMLGTVLDNRVITTPYFRGEIPGGTSEISGNFTMESSKLLADQLNFGALPISFKTQQDEQISPTLGEDQLSKGLLAGLIGLLLVVVYSLFQYRALGLVTIASLLIVALTTYLTLTFFGWYQDLRLTMAGITGAIVAIGTTADSFIIYFERVRDEVREGRHLRAAVQTGWQKAKRTILISDAINFLAAGVLYLLATSNVRGFAFMLMLTTILDLIVVFLFTHPLLTILASTKFFGSGHKWSGFDPEQLGVDKTRYVGAGRVRLASRRRAEGSPA